MLWKLSYDENIKKNMVFILFYFIKNIVEFFIENYTQINSKFWFYLKKKKRVSSSKKI